jgi:hypothetical protein
MIRTDERPALVVLGNVLSRRVSLFCEAAARLGFGTPCLITYRDYLSGRDHILSHVTPGCILRIESPSEDWHVHQQLLCEGIEALAAEGLAPLSKGQIDALQFCRGEIVRPRQWFLGFRRVLARLDRELKAAHNLRLMAHPRDIPILFDKGACQTRWSEAGLPVPRFWTGLRTYDEIRSRMAEERRGDMPGSSADHARLFVKLLHGYSAMGALALEWSGSRVRAISTVEIAPGGRSPRLFVSKRIHVYTRESEISLIIDALGKEGLLVERWLPKARLNGRAFDLRVVAIAGRARHVVGRASTSPFTNLNLDARRIPAADVHEQLGDHYAEALATCERAAACFGRSLYVGIDLLVRPDRRSFALLEANAFGDLLPGLLHRGQDTYEAELAALLVEEEAVAC